MRPFDQLGLGFKAMGLSQIDKPKRHLGVQTGYVGDQNLELFFIPTKDPFFYPEYGPRSCALGPQFRLCEEPGFKVQEGVPG